MQKELLYQLESSLAEIGEYRRVAGVIVGWGGPVTAFLASTKLGSKIALIGALPKGFAVAAMCLLIWDTWDVLVDWIGGD